MLLALLLVRVSRAEDPFWGPVFTDDHFREPTVAVSGDRILQASNFLLTAFDRDGNMEWQARLDIQSEPYDPQCECFFWSEFPHPSPPNSAHRIGDARVLFDPFEQRFIVIGLQFDQRVFYIAFSHDANPKTFTLDDWHKFILDPVLPGEVPNPASIVDFPGLAVNHEYVILSIIVPRQAPATDVHVVQFMRRPPPGTPPSAPPHAPGSFFADPSNHRRVVIPNALPPAIGFPKQRLPMPASCFEVLTPACAYFVQVADIGFSGVSPTVLRAVAVRFDVTGNPLLDFSPVDSDTQDGADACTTSIGCPDIQPNTHRNIQAASYRAGKLACVHMAYRATTGPGHSVARWTEATLNGWPSSGNTPTTFHGEVDLGRAWLNDSPTDDRGINLIYPLVMHTETGDLALFATRYSSYSYADLCWTAHRPFDVLEVGGAPLHFMGAPLTVMRAGSAAVAFPAKWGDYEGIALDPLDGTRVWATGETGRCAPEIGASCSSCSNEPEDCLPVGAPAIDVQGFFHTSIGSYIVPQNPVVPLTISRYGGAQPASITVKVSPADVLADADVTLTAATPGFVRYYGDGSLVRLRAPQIEGWTFFQWIINAEMGPMGPGSRETTVVVDAPRSATPVYTPNP